MSQVKKEKNYSLQTVGIIAAAFLAVASLRYADQISEYIVHNVMGIKNHVVHLKK